MPSELGAFLQARRELVTPDAAGVPVTGVRRVAGLRREEVAMLAGISADYYLRLERGRDLNPSLQVLESLARVLQLDDDTRAYLIGLAAARSRERRKHAARRSAGAIIAFHHPQVGELILNREKLLVSGTDGIMLVVYHPDAGSEAADKLTLLATLAGEYSDDIDVSRASRPNTGVHARSRP